MNGGKEEVKVKKLISIILWTIRRLPKEDERDFVYNELMKAVGDDYSQFVEDSKID